MKRIYSKASYARWCWKSSCVILFNKKHVKRDVLVLVVLVVALGAILSNGWEGKQKGQGKEIAKSAAVNQDNPLSEGEAIKEEENSITAIQSQIDTSAWTPYQNAWYGFFLKYPDGWLDPITQKLTTGAMWEQKIEFRLKNANPDNPFEGFDVEIYNVAKVRELANTDEFPKLKNTELSADGNCATISGHILETGNYPAEEIYIPINDACYNAALFFTNTRGSYIYVITPKIREGMGLAGDPAQEIGQHMPEFFAVAQNWELIDIQRPKPVPPKPKITAPKPVSYIVVNGQLVCAKKNDHPGKSKQNKGKHLDMECCLDPDEYPNPWCYYPPSKYGKYL